MSAYEGHVEPGGMAASRTVTVDDTQVEVRKLSVGPMDNNAYILRDLGSDEALLIDAADDASRLLAELDGLDVVGIVTTHGHADHWQALGELARATGAPVHLHPEDAEMVPIGEFTPLTDEDEIAFGGARVRILHTPGHTPGSVCLLLGKTHLLTGDTLFPGGPGKTRDAEAFQRIMTSLRERLFTLDDETWVYPGHGDDTTLGAERGHLDEWAERGW